MDTMEAIAAILKEVPTRGVEPDAVESERLVARSLGRASGATSRALARPHFSPDRALLLLDACRSLSEGLPWLETADAQADVHDDAVPWRDHYAVIAETVRIAADVSVAQATDIYRLDGAERLSALWVCQCLRVILDVTAALHRIVATAGTPHWTAVLKTEAPHAEATLSALDGMLDLCPLASCADGVVAAPGPRTVH